MWEGLIFFSPTLTNTIHKNLNTNSYSFTHRSCLDESDTVTLVPSPGWQAAILKNYVFVFFTIPLFPASWTWDGFFVLELHCCNRLAVEMAACPLPKPGPTRCLLRNVHGTGLLRVGLEPEPGLPLGSLLVSSWTGDTSSMKVSTCSYPMLSWKGTSLYSRIRV